MTKPRIIAIEEHYHDRELRAQFAAHEVIDTPRISDRLDDLSNLRIKLLSGNAEKLLKL
jgi:hypothetical protein